MKNEAEAYMLKELSLLKWQEKATTLAHEDTSTKMAELQEKVSSLEENLKAERYLCDERSMVNHKKLSLNFNFLTQGEDSRK